MMKHVQLSPYRNRADSVSLSSTNSYTSLSPEPLGSRSSSYSSLNDQSVPQTTIKVYAKCLRPDIEYKTLSVTYQTTCNEVVKSLLNKYRMRHRDPRLFYLSMEVTIRSAGIKTQIALDEDARPAVLQSCHPKGDSRFALQTRRGGLVKIYDSALMSNSQYKSLLISSQTTVDELIALLLNCYSSTERVEQFSIYEVCPVREQQRKLHPDDRPLIVQQSWQHPCHFLVRRNPDYRPLSRRKFTWTADQAVQSPAGSRSMPQLPLLSNLSITGPITTTCKLTLMEAIKHTNNYNMDDRGDQSKLLRNNAKNLATKNRDAKKPVVAIFNRDAKNVDSTVIKKHTLHSKYPNYENFFYI